MSAPPFERGGNGRGEGPDDGAPTIPEDERFLDELFDRAVVAESSGRRLDPEIELGARGHLRERAVEVLRLAREVALQRAPDLEAATARPELDGYELLEEVGRGGMGVVYRALQRGLGRTVAVKFLLPSLIASGSSVARFLVEARALARLSHPNIVTVHEVLENRGRHAYVMEFVSGRSLASRIATGALATNDAAAIAEAIGRALGVVHSAGLVHRDVKPSNILFRDDGTPLLGDFGLVQDQATTSRTTIGVFLGTACYAAPEQLRGQHDEIGPWTDVFSLGATLYHALAGAPPVTRASPFEILSTIERDGVIPLHRTRRRVPRELSAVVGKAMDPSPRARYSNGEEFADDLGRFLRGEPVRARAAGPLRRLRKWAARSPLLAAAVFALFLALAGGLAVALHLLGRVASERDESERREYFAQLSAAEAALRSSDLLNVRAHLDAAPVALRGWEWHYIDQRLDQGRVLTTSTDWVHDLAATTDGRRLAVAGRDGRATIIDTASGTPLAEFRHPTAVRRIAWAPDEALLLTLTYETLFLRDGSNGALRRRFAIEGGGRTAAFSPDGKSIAIGTRGGRLLLCDVAPLLGDAGPAEADADRPLAIRKRMGSGDSGINAVVFSPRGWIASGGDDGRIRIWSTGTASLDATLEFHARTILDLAVAPDGRTLASASADRTIALWDVEARLRQATLLGHGEDVQSVAFSPDGEVIASASEDFTVRTWNRSGTPRQVLAGHRGTVRTVTFVGSSGLLASGASAARDRTVRLWELDGKDRDAIDNGMSLDVHQLGLDPESRWFAYTRRELGRSFALVLGSFERHAGVGVLLRGRQEEGGRRPGFAVSGGGEWVAVDSGDNAIALFRGSDLFARVQTAGSPMPSAFRSLPEPLRTPRALAFDREARRLFAGFDDGSVAEWTLASGIRRKVVTGRPGPVTSLAASPDGGELVVSAPGGLTAFDATSFEVRREWPLVAESDAMAYSPDGRWFAYADRVEFPSIVIVDRRRGTEARRLNGLPRPVESLAFSPDGKRLAATSYDRTVRLWDLETGAPTAIFREHSHWTTAVAWSDDGSYLVSGSADGTLRFRRVRRQGTAVAR